MRSKLAEQLKREQREEVARMSPSQRLALAKRIADDALAMFMAANRLDREAALQTIRKSRRAGRKPSRCFDERR